MNPRKAYFAAGCFWGVEESFRTTSGVLATCAGYSGGSVVNPSYEQVCSGRTGHAETVEVTFDSDIVSYDQLLDVFWQIHDPTQHNRQGPDVGTQYRSAIFTVNEDQRAAAEASKDRLEQSGTYTKAIATEVTAASAFYLAEEYHQQYLAKRGRASCASH